METLSHALQLLENCEAVLFDFDGLILDTEWPIYESYERLYQKEGQHLELATYVACIGSDHANWSPQTHLEELTGRSYDWPKINAERQSWIEVEVAKRPIQDGVVELLHQLKGEGKKSAVVSSSNHSWVDRWLAHLGLAGQFDAVVCREDAAAIKPAPDLFLEGARQLACEPAQCLVLEDSLNGVLAANSAGCPVIAVPSRITSVVDFSSADAVVASLLDLRSDTTDLC